MRRVARAPRARMSGRSKKSCKRKLKASDNNIKKARWKTSGLHTSSGPNRQRTVCIRLQQISERQILALVRCKGGSSILSCRCGCRRHRGHRSRGHGRHGLCGRRTRNSSHRLRITVHLECADAVKPTSVILMSIYIKGHRHHFAQLDIELLNTVNAEYLEVHLTGILIHSLQHIRCNSPF